MRKKKGEEGERRVRRKERNEGLLQFCLYYNSWEYEKYSRHDFFAIKKVYCGSFNNSEFCFPNLLLCIKGRMKEKGG